MRSFAYTILFVILLAILIEPMVEMAIILEEKVVLGSAISSSCLAAKSESLMYEHMIEMDAVIDQVEFISQFSNNFSKIMDATCVSATASRMVFKDNDVTNKNYTIDVDILQRVEPLTQKIVTDLEIHVETNYVYKTKYLKEADSSVGGLDYRIICDRGYIAIIEN